ncbi:hypothetical protein HMPREF9004_0838 [Schaalia cardiffensis F0333]|uniref:Uncharacterized protein n=1 Tax=Schaalia cardiffensis F0333 TaxID=888050 RepID=N6WDK0_9ACTO|nr:hypothetical protein HMPREF9004_0838 [Schaalia cardiffensis F0333]
MEVPFLHSDHLQRPRTKHRIHRPTPAPHLEDSPSLSLNLESDTANCFAEPFRH